MVDFPFVAPAAFNASSRDQQCPDQSQTTPSDSFMPLKASGKILTVARQFDVSRETLRRRVNGGRPSKGKAALHSNLSNAEEEALYDYVDRLNKLRLSYY